MTRRRRDEGGFTLIELLVVMVILPLVIGALSSAIITILKNTQTLNNTGANDPSGTAVRLADSHDAQLSSVYFVRDVQSAAVVSTSATALCAPAGSGNEQLVGLEWQTAAGKVDVSYFVQQSSPPELVRYYCLGNAYQDTSVVSHDVFNKLGAVAPGACPASGFGTGDSSCAISSSAAYAAALVECTDGTVTCASASPANVIATVGTPGVKSVQIYVFENQTTGYQYSLTGIPRLFSSVAAGGPPSNSPQSPFISNGSISAGNCNILVNGAVAVNDSASPSVTVGPTGSITATDIYTTDPNSGGAVSGSGSYPQPVTYGAPVASPYDALTEPPSAPSGAPYPVITETASDWDPSTALAQPITPAIYIVTNGMSVSKGLNAANGVLFYVTGGNVSLNGNGNLLLDPLAPNWEAPTQPTPEVVLWISKNDVSPNNPPTLTLGGNGNTTTINGAVYAPTAALTINGGGTNGGVTTQALDIGSIATCNGGGSVAENLTVGSTLASGTFVQPATQAITTGQSDSAKATVVGDGKLAATGLVTFYECGPEVIPNACTNITGTQVGPAVALVTGANGVSTASSPTVTPPLPGNYCFAAYYGGSASYNPSSDTSTSTDGCFSVSGPPAPVITAPTNNGCYSSNANRKCPTSWPGSITGAATDAGGPGLLSVQLSIEDKTTGLYWNGSSFASTIPVANQASDISGTGSFSTWGLPFPSSNLSAGDTFAVVATSTDKANATGPPSAIVGFTWKG